VTNLKIRHYIGRNYFGSGGVLGRAKFWRDALRLRQIVLVGVGFLGAAGWTTGGPEVGGISGNVTFTGTAPRMQAIDMSKEYNCAKEYAGGATPTSETVVVGKENELRNVVVFVFAGPAEANRTAGAAPAVMTQKGCRYAPHVVAVQAGKEVKITTSDNAPHNVYLAAKVNRPANLMQTAGGAPIQQKFDKPEFIPVKCNIHPWMRGIVAVVATPHYAVTGKDGEFKLPNLPPGKYTIKAWHETLGEQTQEVTIDGTETKIIEFVFKAKK